MAADLNSIINSIDLTSIINTIKAMMPYIALAAAPGITVALSLGGAGLWFGGAALSAGIGVTALIIGIVTIIPALQALL
jgi:hypothetical protein